jgi:hypothetical protein
MSKWFETLKQWFFISLLVGLVILYGIGLFRDHDSTVTFNITGACQQNYTVSERYNLDYQCLQFCANKYYDASTYREKCWEMCKELGCWGCHDVE